MSIIDMENYYGILLFIWLFHVYNVRTSIPISYGRNYGDKTIGYGDDLTKKVTLDETITIYDKSFKSFHISYNGGLFQAAYSRIALDDMWTDFPEYSILPYWADANFIKCNDCNVYYRYNVDDDTLIRINSLVKLHNVFDIGYKFEALSRKTLVVTWDNAPSYANQGQYQNTFQLVLTSDGKDTYAIFAYEDITYPGYFDINPKIGYYISDNLVCGLSAELYEDVTQLPCESNVYTPGVFVLHLTSRRCPDGVFTSTCINCGSSSTTFCSENDIQETFEMCLTNNEKYENKCELKKELCHSRGALTTKQCEVVGGECGDIGECHEKAFCKHSTSGVYQCLCLPGYDGDGKNCLEKNECAERPCQNNQVCRDLVNDYKCDCQYPWTGKNCELFAPCQDNNGGCEENCAYDSNLQLQCSCKGKPLDSDKKTCTKGSFAVVGLNGYIFYDNINYQHLHELPINNQDIKLQNIQVTGLDIDYINNVIYFMDSSSFSIRKVNRDGTGLETLVQGRSSTTSFDDLVFDSEREYLFWSEGTSIIRYSLSTAQITEVIKSNNTIRSLLLLKEDCKRRIYWSESELPTPGIRYTNMDQPSTTPKTIINEWIYLPQGLTADHVKQKIYWLDNFFNRIESVNYDGSCRKLLVEKLPKFLFALSYYDNALYFSHWESFSLRKYDLLNGTNDTLAIYGSRSFGVKIYNPSQPYSCKNVFKCDVSDEPSNCKEETCIHGSCDITEKCICNVGFKGDSCEIKDDTFTFARSYFNTEISENIFPTQENSDDEKFSTFIQPITNSSITNTYIIQNETNTYLSTLYLQSQELEQNNILQIIHVKQSLNSQHTFLNKNHMNDFIGNNIKCFLQKLENPFDEIPFVIVQQESHTQENTSPTWHLQIWLRDVAKESFLICVQEMINFSGLKNITLHYLAITKQSSIFSELGVYEIEKNEFNALKTYCHDVSFENSYKRPPYVFLMPEVLSNSARILTWVSHVTKTFMTLCYQSLFTFTEEGALKLHYAVKAANDACEKVSCSHLEDCVEDEFGIGKCMCRNDCSNEEDSGPVCSSSRKTYQNLCEFTKHICEYGDTSETIIYNGICQDFAYEFKKDTLIVDPEIPIAFCKNVSITTDLFKPAVPLQVHLTVTWEDANQEINILIPHEATASWVEHVNHESFKICVVVAGRNYNGDFIAPNINWFAYQTLSENVIPSGTVAMETWYSGSRCSIIEDLPGYDDNNSTIMVSVEHSLDQTIENAVTSWIERAEGNTLYRVCVRELQNFDGKHEGLKLHWIVLSKDVIDEEIIFGIESVNMDQHHMGAPKCKKVAFNKILTKVPQVQLTAIIEVPIEKFRASTTISDNDVSVWIEKSSMTYFEFCCKSIRSSLYTHQLKISYVVFHD